MAGAYCITDLPDVVTLECKRCNRFGRYKRSTLIARFGTDIMLPDLQLKISGCPHTYRSPCGVMFTNLSWW